MRKIFVIIFSLTAVIALAACDAIAPPPPPTAAPTDTPTPAPSPTPTPTMGPREYLDAAACWPSPIDTGEFNLLRFFNNGIVLEATVAPFADCQAALERYEQWYEELYRNRAMINEIEGILAEIQRLERLDAWNRAIEGRTRGGGGGAEIDWSRSLIANVGGGLLGRRETPYKAVPSLGGSIR